MRSRRRAARQIRYIGCSNPAAWQIMKALGIGRQRGWTSFALVQALYSLAGRDNLAAMDVPLSDADIGELDAVSELPASYPAWIQSYSGRPLARRNSGRA